MKNLLSIVFALLLLVSNTGLVYAQHFCGGKIITNAFMIGENSLGCSDDEAKESVYNTHNENMPECCDNIYLQVISEDDYAGSSFDFQPDFSFVYAFISVFYELQTVQISEKEVRFSEYLPPPEDEDLSVLYQTFLI